MDNGRHEQRVIVPPESAMPKAWVICLSIIWLWIVIGYLYSFHVFLESGTDMSFGMITYLVPAIVFTILYIIYRIYRRFRPIVFLTD